MNKICFFTFFILFLLCNFVLAGPFGTSMGDKESKFSNLNLMNNFPNGVKEYSTNNMINPYPGLNRYILTFNADNGLSKVEGFKEFTYKDGADALFNYFNKVLGELKNKYGKANINREGYAEWTKKLPENLTKIRLLIVPDEKNGRALIALEYTYKNYIDVKKYYKKGSDAL